MSTSTVVEGQTEQVINDEADRLLREKNQAAIELPRSWREVDGAGAQEQRETREALEKALGEDRNSYRKLF